MTFSQKITLFGLRISLGALYLYAGLTKVFDSSWSSAGYLKGAKGFAAFYASLLDPAILPAVDFANKWGLTLLGISLILGAGVRVAAPLGALLMALYYLPLGFPYPNAHAFIVDEHIIYIFALGYLACVRAGRIWGLDAYCVGCSFCRRFPRICTWVC